MRRPVRAIPLSYRLPNPPPVFLGREREARQLSELLARSAFVAVTGPGGLGKTALALEVLSAQQPPVVHRALFIAIPPAEPLEQVCRTLLHALAALAGREDALDLPAIQGDFTLTLESILDLAQATQAWIVLDDVHHVVEGDVEELLLPLATYARDTRVVATSRRGFEAPRLREPTLALGRLADGELRALAYALSTERDALDSLLPLASGSPWILKQVLARGRRGASEGLATLLADLTPSDTDLLHRLALLRAEASHLVLEAIGASDPEALQRLMGRGLVQSSGGQTRVHDMVADLVGASMTPAARRAHGEALRDKLAATDEPAVWLHAIRIAFELGDANGAMALLSERGEGILALGLAPRLFHVLSATSHPGSLTWRLRCAAELGNATALEAVRRAHLEGPRDQLSWAYARYLEGEPRAAADLARKLMAAGDEWMRPARCLLARAELVDDHPERAIEVLEAIASPSLEEAALLAQARALLHRPEALATIERALAAAGSSDAGPSIDAAEALMLLERDAHALALVDEAARAPRGASPSHLIGRQGLLLRARLATARGELTETARLLDRVRPFARGVSFMRVRLVVLDVRRRLALGECDGLPDVIAQCLTSARVADAASVRAIEALSARAARVCRTKGWQTLAIASDESLHAALEASARSLARGDVALAEVEGRTALQRARGPLDELEALSVLADVSLVAGAALAHRERVARLAALADQVDSPRFRLEASFHEEHHDLAALERLAQQAATSPSTAKRARALLGVGRAALDPADARVVAAVAERLGVVEPLVELPSEEWAPGWGLHVERSAVWLSDGRWLSFERKPVLWGLLLLVAEARGAEVDKETLVLRVWNERSYHPGLHDAKLHVAVRALRKELEEVPAHPTRFLTTRGGYCLGGPCRRLG